MIHQNTFHLLLPPYHRTSGQLSPFSFNALLPQDILSLSATNGVSSAMKTCSGSLFVGLTHSDVPTTHKGAQK